MDIQRLIAATNIALLRRQFPALLIEEQIWEGLKMVKRLMYEEAVGKEAGDTVPFEAPIVEVNKITANVNYTTIVEKTIASGRTAKIAKMEMACRVDLDYDITQWRLTVNSKIVFEDKPLPSSLTLDLADITISGGKVMKVEARTTAGTAEVWADITGKEIF